MVKKEDKEKGVEQHYVCPNCAYGFIQRVRYVAPYNDGGVEAKHGGCSDQVKCKRCGYFIKTWRE